jgi:ribosomal protein S6
METQKNSRIYEVSYLVRLDVAPAIAEETVARSITAFLTEKAIRIISAAPLEEIDLAYEIRKDIENKKERFVEAYFGFTKFEAEPQVIKELHESLDLEKNIIRFLIVKTIEDNTVLPRREKRQNDEGEALEDVLSEIEDVSVVLGPEEVSELTETATEEVKEIVE